MASKQQLAYFHGVMLPMICKKMGITPTPCHKEAYKAMLKKHMDIDSFSDLNNQGMTLFIEQSVRFLSTEFSIEIDLPGEKDTENMSMQDFLKLIYK